MMIPKTGLDNVARPSALRACQTEPPDDLFRGQLGVQAYSVKIRGHIVCGSTAQRHVSRKRCIGGRCLLQFCLHTELCVPIEQHHTDHYRAIQSH